MRLRTSVAAIVVIVIAGGGACCGRGDALCMAANAAPPAIAMTPMATTEVLKRMDVGPVNVVSAAAGGHR